MKKILLFLLISANLIPDNSFFHKTIGKSVVYGCPEYDTILDFKTTADINGDGYIDIIGKLNVWNGWTYCIWIMYGSSEKLPEELSICDYSGRMTYMYGNGNWSYLVGIQVGDFNGDGYDDLVIGNWWASIQSDYPEVFIIYGSADLPQQIEIGNFPSNLKVTRIEARDEYSHLGQYISAGDMNGDGYEDLILSEVANPDLNKEGILYIIYSSPNGLPSFIDISNPPANTKIIFGPDPFYWFGYRSDIFDANNDGLNDLIVSIKWFDYINKVEDRRILIIYYNGQDGFPQKVDPLNLPENSTIIYDACLNTNFYQFFYFDPVLVYDFDNDGYNDIFVASSIADKPGSKNNYSGEIWIIYGTPSGFPKTIDLLYPPEASTVIYGADQYDAFGTEVEIGDINNDGNLDVVSANGSWGYGTYVGKIWVIYGNGKRFPGVVDLTNVPKDIKIYSIEGTEENAAIGSRLNMNDLDKDGFKDFIFSSCMHRSYNGYPICEFNIFYYSIFKFIN